MSWIAELVEAVDDDERLFAIVDTLQQKLIEDYETRNFTEAQQRLAALAGLLEEETSAVGDLLDKTSLYLCAPCLECSVLSPDCSELCSRILNLMLENASPREVFTGDVWNGCLLSLEMRIDSGAVDGLSMLLETASAEEMCAVLVLVLDFLLKTVSKIKRKQERFCSICLHLVVRLAQKLQEGYLDEVAFCMCLQFGHKLLAHEEDNRMYKLSAFTLLVSKFCFASLLWKSGLDISERDSRSNLEEELVHLLKYLQPLQDSFPACVHQLAKVWSEDAHEANGSYPDQSELARELHQSCALLTWASIRYSNLGQIFDSPLDKTVLYLLAAEPILIETPYVVAATEIVHRRFKQLSKVGESFWKEACSKLIDHMNEHSVPQLRILAATTIQFALEHQSDSIKWVLLNDLILVENSEIAAIMVQHLKAAVVSAWDSRETESIFCSAKVIDHIKKVLGPADTDTQLQHNAELYCAVLNLYLFVSLRDAKREPEVPSVIDSSTRAAVNDRLVAMKQQIDILLQENEDLGLLRLKLSIDNVVGRTDNVERNM